MKNILFLLLLMLIPATLFAATLPIAADTYTVDSIEANSSGRVWIVLVGENW